LQQTSAVAGRFARGLPRASVVLIPNATHFLFDSNPNEVLAAMRAFIDALPQSSRFAKQKISVRGLTNAASFGVWMTSRVELMTDSRHGERLMTGTVVAGTVALMLVTMGRAVIVLSSTLVIAYAIWLTRALPGRVFGAKAWSAEQFFWFNVLWLIAFLLAGIAIARHWRPAYVVALFLAFGGGITNGVGHLALSTLAGGYYPGLYTAPLALVAGLFLAWRLLGSSRR